MREVLTTAREVSELTDGKFDITFGALGGLWKFDAQNQDNSIPTRADIERRLPFIDYHDVVVDAAAGTAFVKRKGVTANLGGIGKGYAVDRAAAILRQAGLRDFMIQFGGDLYLAGRRGSRPWRAAIRDPRGPVEKTFAALDLSDETFSTSGDYERFFMADGKRYHPEGRLVGREQGRRARSEQADDGDEDGGLRTDPIVEEGEPECAQARGDVERDPKQQHLVQTHSEGAGGIDASEREQLHQAVGIDHVGEQERRQRSLLRQLAQGSLESAQSHAQRLAHGTLRRIVRRQPELRQH
jgi:hypothetical protein